MTDKQLIEQEMKRLDAPAKKTKKTGEPILTATLADCMKAKPTRTVGFPFSQPTEVPTKKEGKR